MVLWDLDGIHVFAAINWLSGCFCGVSTGCSFQRAMPFILQWFESISEIRGDAVLAEEVVAPVLSETWVEVPQRRCALRQKMQRVSGEVDQFCVHCHMWLNGSFQWQEHIFGRKHRKNLSNSPYFTATAGEVPDRG